jgi:SAM-dependent methyltransferase
MRPSTVSKDFFEEKYRRNRDPWDFARSSYELNRYDEILRLLGHRTFNRAFEPGCSVGILTERLAVRCQHLFAMDISPTATAMARQRCVQQRNVTIAEGALPSDLPGGTFDLIVFSEIGYYFDRDALAEIRDLLVGRLTKPGLFIGGHWLGMSEDHLLTGDEVHAVLRTSGLLAINSSQRHEGFLLESWERV